VTESSAVTLPCPSPRPVNMLLLLGGSVVVTSGYLAALYFAIRALGGDLSLAQVGAIYLTGSAVASAAPPLAASVRSKLR